MATRKGDRMKLSSLSLSASLFCCVILSIMACGSQDDEVFTVERRITLLDLVGELAGRIVSTGEPVYKFSQELGGVRRSCMCLKYGQSVIFNNLSIHPRARLEFLLGTPVPAEMCVRISVKVLEGDARPPRRPERRFFSAKEAGWHCYQEDMADFKGCTVRLKLEVWNETTRGEVLIGKPVLLSDGRRVRPEDQPRVAVEELVRDLIKDFAAAEKIRENPDKPLGTYPPIYGKEAITAALSSKKIVYAMPESAFAFYIDIPKGAYLEVAPFLFPMAGLGADDPGNVEFSANVNGENLFSVRSDFINAVPPYVVVYDRNKYLRRVDLAPWAGRRVKMVFETRCLEGEPSGPFGYCWWDLKVKRRILIPRKKASPERPNVILLCIDALRADHVSSYGYARTTTPNLDAFAERSLLFERAVSPCSWTMPATASLLTGLHPNSHGVLGNMRSYLIEGVTTLPEYLSAQGVTTGAFTANHLVCAAANFKQGFEFFDEIQECAEGIHDDLFSWLESCVPFQFFGYVHYMEPHTPYNAPGIYRQHFDPDYQEKRDFTEAFREGFKQGAVEKPFTTKELVHIVNLYDAEIYYWDLQFRKLLDRLKSLNLHDRTVIIVTADHGEEFLEHGRLGHGWTVYNELIHVPLILHDPRMIKGVRIRDPVDTTALFCTIADLMGFDSPDFTQVSGLLPPDRLSERFDLLYASTESTTLETGARWACVIDFPLKLISNTAGEGVELYHLVKDPEELNDLSESLPEKASRLKDKVFEWYRTTAEVFPGDWQPFTPEMKKRLEELGYLGN